MKIPFTNKDLVAHVPLSAPKEGGERIENPTIKQRFADYGWLPLRVKPADRHTRPPRTTVLERQSTSTAQSTLPKQTTSPLQQSKLPLSDSEITAIADIARNTLSCWDKSAGASLNEASHELDDSHIRMAAMLDALYKKHFGSKFDRQSLAAVPDDTQLRSILAKTLGTEQGSDSVQDLGASLRARETLRILYEGFDSVPHLRDIDAGQRWRLIVDRRKIDLLAKHGIDTNNPLLCFIFDSDRGYAHGMARGYECMGSLRAQGRTFDAGLIPELAAACGAGALHPTQMTYGADHTKNGAMALADWMMRFHKDYNVMTGAHVDDKHVATTGGFFVQRPASYETAGVKGGYKHISDQALRSLFESRFDKDAIVIVRGDTDEETLKRVDQDIVQRFETESKGATSPDEKILAAAQAYYDGEHKHGQADGNYRLFSKLILNFLLLQQGQSMTDLYDPDRADGQSPKELVDTIKEGQAWIASLSSGKTEASASAST